MRPTIQVAWYSCEMIHLGTIWFNMDTIRLTPRCPHLLVIKCIIRSLYCLTLPDQTSWRESALLVVTARCLIWDIQASSTGNKGRPFNMLTQDCLLYAAQIPFSPSSLWPLFSLSLSLSASPFRLLYPVLCQCFYMPAQFVCSSWHRSSKKLIRV